MLGVESMSPDNGDSLPPGGHVDMQEGGDAGTARGPLQRKDAKAVALQWEEGTGTVPKVAASGRGYMAEQILALAFEHGVKVREDADLVELLAALDIDSPIPVEAYMAVAEILSYVYRANAAARQGKPFDTVEQP